MTVAELLERMSSREFSEWMLYYDLEPFGEERADLRQAMTTSAVHNSVIAQSKHPKWTKPENFMPFSEKEEADMDEQEMPTADLLRQKFMAFAGKKQGDA